MNRKFFELSAMAGTCIGASTVLSQAAAPPSPPIRTFPLDEQTAKLKLVEVVFRWVHAMDEPWDMLMMDVDG